MTDAGDDLGFFTAEAHQVIEPAATKRTLGGEKEDRLEQVGLALPVVAEDDVYARMRLVRDLVEVAKVAGM